MVGSRPFMAPEQIMGQSERRSDIWAIGVLMYLLYTGELPFYSEVEKLLIDQILEQEPLPPREENPEIPPALEAVILKCLKKKLEERYVSAVALRATSCANSPSTAPRAGGGRGSTDPPGHRGYLLSAGAGAVPVVGRGGRGHLRRAAGRGLLFYLLGPPGLYPLSSGFHPLAGGPAALCPGRSALGRLLGGTRWFRPLFIIGLVVLLSHLLLDLATSYGTQVLSPFSRRRFSLDWIFIIDPYFTALLLMGAIAALSFPSWGPRAGAWFLATAAVYLLVCASYHHQALDLARRVLKDGKPGGATVAALPQPFSCRRWQLIAAGPAEIQQAFVQLPWEAALGLKAEGGKAAVLQVTQSQACPSPATPYQEPGHLTIQSWTQAPAAATVYSPEAEPSWPRFLEFARFPLLCRAGSQGGEEVLEWRDLRFSVPGRGFPFVLQLRLDAHGRLQHWLIGRRG